MSREHGVERWALSSAQVGSHVALGASSPLPSAVRPASEQVRYRASETATDLVGVRFGFDDPGTSSGFVLAECVEHHAQQMTSLHARARVRERAS
jgi:hypothetical protein